MKRSRDTLSPHGKKRPCVKPNLDIKRLFTLALLVFYNVPCFLLAWQADNRNSVLSWRRTSYYYEVGIARNKTIHERCRATKVHSATQTSVSTVLLWRHLTL